MTTVYIAGPVVRSVSSLEKQRERSQIYNHIYETLTAAGLKVIVPSLSETTENADPQAFFQIMKDRISASDAVITVFPERNRSVPVEATMASFMNKAQYVVAGDIDAVPRILKGLPGLSQIVSVDDVDRVLDEIQRRSTSGYSEDDNYAPLSAPVYSQETTSFHPSEATGFYSQEAINYGQRRINYALTVVDERLLKAIEALRDAIAALPAAHNIYLNEVNAAIAYAYDTSSRVADIRPPGCDPM
jgi:hypothetical protein